MSSKKMLSTVLAAVLCGACCSVSAQNLVKNGSFEEETPMPQADAVTQKGFKLDFDNARWASGWVINVGTVPATVTFVGTDAPDGKRHLRVMSKGGTHVYTQDTLPGDKSYKCSLSGKGQEYEGKAPVLKIHAYLYKKTGGAWAGKNNLVGTFNLEEKWKQFDCAIPAVGEELVVRIAFEFQGTCDVDGVKIEEVK